MSILTFQYWRRQRYSRPASGRRFRSGLVLRQPLEPPIR